MVDADLVASGGVFLLMLSAIICNIAGVFCKEWWIDNQGTRYGIFTVVSCDDGRCLLASGSSEGWIVFAQVSGLTMCVMLTGAICSYIICIIVKKHFARVLTIGGLFVACGCSVLHTFVLVGYYRQIAYAYDRRYILPINMVVFQTLPVGLTAIAGTICVPAFICLIVQQTKQRNHLADKQNQGQGTNSGNNTQSQEAGNSSGTNRVI